MPSREPELYKDKIEVSLDGRQVFYLFFGGAIIACLVFVLGVMVGKRVEARAHLDRTTTTSVRDPLAALDRLSTDGPHELSFRQALTGGAAPASDVERQIAEIEKVRAQAAGPDKKLEPAKPAAAAVKFDEAKDEAKPDPVKPDPVKPAAAKKVDEPRPPVAAVDRPAARPSDVDAAATAKKGRFTLQLSAFQDKVEAEAFLAEVKVAGFEAYLTEANVEDKGTFFRVRLGSYPTYDDAVVAKADFERKVKKIAYVSRI
jgi:DedD protein